MAPRPQLHSLLETFGATQVYFQPPPTVEMSYPCIRYSLDMIETNFADDNPYNHTKRYSVTVIDRNPDSDIPARVGSLPMCVFDRFYTADNLNHFVYRLFF